MLKTWKFSSAGRASALQAEGHRFEPCNFHFLLQKAMTLSWLFAIKNVLHLSRMTQKGSGNKVFPEWNPQGELRLPEGNRKFQGVCTDGTYLFGFCLNNSKAHGGFAAMAFELGA